ncbi:hypothetical protein D3C78_975450 [compost metagenome]
MYGHQQALGTIGSRITLPEPDPERRGVGPQLKGGGHIVCRIDLRRSLVGDNGARHQWRLDHPRVLVLLLGEAWCSLAKQVRHAEMQAGAADPVDLIRIGKTLAIVVAEPEAAVLRVPVKTHRIAHALGQDL